MKSFKLSKAKKFLQTLDSVCAWLSYPGPGQIRFIGRPDAYFEWRDYEIRFKERRSFHYLKQQKLIEAKKIGERLLVRLTDKGYSQLLKDQLRTYKKKSLDGVYFVVFDIPESQRKTRNLFRLFLKECGFKKLQQSIWFTDKEVGQALVHFVLLNKLQSWVHIMRGKVLTK